MPMSSFKLESYICRIHTKPLKKSVVYLNAQTVQYQAPEQVSIKEDTSFFALSHSGTCISSVLIENVPLVSLFQPTCLKGTQ